MIVECATCYMAFEDKYRSTVCPHDTFAANDGKNNFAHHREAFLRLVDDNPDPTGVFSKTEFDLASAKGLSAPEPPPICNDLPAVWDLVIQDMRQRDAMGAAKYKTRLQPFNGRDALIDAYQEALDLVVYFRQLIFERNGS